MSNNDTQLSQPRGCLHSIIDIVIIFFVLGIFSLLGIGLYLYTSPSVAKEWDFTISEMIVQNTNISREELKIKKAKLLNLFSKRHQYIQNAQPVDANPASSENQTGLVATINPTLSHKALRMFRTGTYTAQQVTNAVIITEESIKVNQDPFLLLAIALHVSNLDTNASGKQGTGLFKMSVNKGQSLARLIGIEWDGINTLKDPNYSTQLALKQISLLNNHFENGTEAILYGYFLGAQNYYNIMYKGEGTLPNDVKSNVDNILALYDKIKGQD